MVESHRNRLSVCVWVIEKEARKWIRQKPQPWFYFLIPGAPSKQQHAAIPRASIQQKVFIYAALKSFVNLFMYKLPG